MGPFRAVRNFDELRRVDVIALQTTDAFSVATPADWRPGEAVIVPTAGSCGLPRTEWKVTKPASPCTDCFFIFSLTWTLRPRTRRLAPRVQAVTQGPYTLV